MLTKHAGLQGIVTAMAEEARRGPITIVLADDHQVVAIESHRAHIQQRTGRTTRAALVAYAREHELL